MQSLLFSLVLSTAAFASPATAIPDAEPLIVRSQVNQQNVEVLLANLEQERVSIQIHDLNRDRKVFSDVIKNRNGYSYGLCFEKLPEGRYVISVKKGDTVRKQVVLKTETGTMCSDWK